MCSGAVEPDRGCLVGFQASAASLGAVGIDQLIFDGDLEYLSQTGQGLVDRGDRQGAAAPGAFAPVFVEVLRHQRATFGCCLADRVSFCHLGLPVSVDLGDRDLLR
jgi:hypothetical protein